jgi:hypothetical protein
MQDEIMPILQNVEAHKQKEEESFLEIIPEHISRGEASQGTLTEPETA